MSIALNHRCRPGIVFQTCEEQHHPGGPGAIRLVPAGTDTVRRLVRSSSNNADIPIFSGRRAMHLSNENLLIIVLVGLIAGWLAGQVMRGAGFGLVGDLIIGLLGALIGDWLLPRLDIHIGIGLLALVINAFIGAIVLLIILRLVGGGTRWRRQW
jgi:uncharacterized membrane protein YeaQ/YmgE (transglycosylase-associated protein family)